MIVGDVSKFRKVIRKVNIVHAVSIAMGHIIAKDCSHEAGKPNMHVVANDRLNHAGLEAPSIRNADFGPNGNTIPTNEKLLK